MKLLKCMMIFETIYRRCPCYSWRKSIVCWERNWLDLLILPIFAFSNYISLTPCLRSLIALSAGPFLSCGQYPTLSSWERLRQSTYAEEGAPQIPKSPFCPLTSRSQPCSRQEQGPGTGRAWHRDLTVSCHCCTSHSLHWLLYFPLKKKLIVFSRY